MSALATVTPETRVALDVPVAAADEPQQGDVVVEPALGTPGRFTVRQAPARPSLAWKSREEAVEVARGFARAYAVDVWFGSGQSVERVHIHRSATCRAH